MPVNQAKGLTNTCGSALTPYNVGLVTVGQYAEFAAMHWVVGLLLVMAATLKAAQLIIDPAATVDDAFPRWLMPLQISLELAVGCLAVSGAYWRQLRWIALVLFAGFAGNSLHQALNGAASCGCFGPVKMNPWWTFCLDVAIVAGLAVSFVQDRRTPPTLPTLSALPISYSPRPHHLFVAAMSVAIVSATVLVRYVDRRAAAADDLTATAGGLVILEPETWIGKKLPIANWIDIDLSRGNWFAVLHRHDCPACQEVLPHFEALATSGESVALVEVPPYGPTHANFGDCRHGRLSDDRDWFVQTPVEILLREGIVTAVKVHGH